MRRRCARIKSSAGNRGIRESRGRRVGELVALHPGTGCGAGQRHRRHRVNPLRGSCAGTAALAGDTAPSASRRLPMAGRILPALSGAAEKNTERTSTDGGQSAAYPHADQSGGRPGRCARTGRRRVRPRPSSHRCISSISSTHWTMTRPAAGGDFVLQGAEADADVDAAFDGSLRWSAGPCRSPVSCGALSPYCPVGRAREHV